jgi:hypothetical protein
LQLSSSGASESFAPPFFARKQGGVLADGHAASHEVTLRKWLCCIDIHLGSF